MNHLLRWSILLLGMLVGLAGAYAADLVDQVPRSSRAYQHLKLLAQCGLLSEQPDQGHSRITVLTRYEFTFKLIEPLERLTALVEAQDDPMTMALEQRRRKDLAYHAVSDLSAREFDDLLAAASELLVLFHADLNEMMPGLTPRATTALQKLTQPKYRPWIQQRTTSRPDDPNISFMLNPKVTPETIGNPLPLLPIRATGPWALPMQAGGPDPEKPVIGSRPLNSMEAAIDVAFRGFQLYGSVSSLPGDNAGLLIKSNGLGRAMLGFRVDLGSLNKMGIAGIFEYHVMRAGEDGNNDVMTGAVGGIGITW